MRQMLLKTVAAVLALALLLSGCGRREAPREESPVYGLEAPLGQEALRDAAGQTVGEALATTYAADDVFSLNAVFASSFHPYQLSSTWNQLVSMLVYETMVVIDENFDAQPGLITQWETTDGRNWTFYVNTERRFHSGGRVTAVDCVYSLRMLLGLDAYNERFYCISDTEVIDNGSFTVTLDSPDYNFYRMLNVPCIESGSFYDDIPPGSGPYKFSAAGDMLLLDSQHPEADSMPLLRIYLKEYTDSDQILQAFEDSSLDLVINNPTAMSNLGYSSTNITRYVETTNMHYLGYNMRSILFSQATFRAMMSYAVDRSGIVASCMGGAGVAAALPIHPNNALYDWEIADAIDYSMDSLTRIVEQLHLVDVDGDGFYELYSGVSNMEQSINFIVCADSSAKVMAANRIADTLGELGLRVNVRALSYNDYIEALKEGDFDLYYAEVKLRPNWDIRPLFDNAEESINYGMVRDSFLNEYIRSFLGSPPELQAQSAQSLWQYIAQQAPITVIAFERSEVLYHRGVISGLAPLQENIFAGMSGWTVDLSANNSATE